MIKLDTNYKYDFECVKMGNSKRLCMQCRTRDVWLDKVLCFECYMKKTDKAKIIEPKRESYSTLELPGKRIKTKKKKNKKIKR